jgi:hypothetical protein
MEKFKKPAISTLEKALAEYSQKGKVDSTRCERCNTPIEIVRRSESVFTVTCACGLYNDNLRGL